MVIEVVDRGVGIPQQDLSHIFEPFKRGANVNGHRGTGLGPAQEQGMGDV